MPYGSRFSTLGVVCLLIKLLISSVRETSALVIELCSASKSSLVQYEIPGMFFLFPQQWLHVLLWMDHLYQPTLELRIQYNSPCDLAVLAFGFLCVATCYRVSLLNEVLLTLAMVRQYVNIVHQIGHFLLSVQQQIFIRHCNIFGNSTIVVVVLQSPSLFTILLQRSTVVGQLRL